MATTEHLRAESRCQQEEQGGEYMARAALLDWAADEIDKLRQLVDAQNKLIECYRMYRQPPDSLLRLLDDVLCKRVIHDER